MPRATRTPWLGKEPSQYVWYIYWYDKAGGRYRRRSTRTEDRSQAEKALGRFIVELASKEDASGTAQPPEQYLIATALRWYLQERGPEISTKDLVARTVEQFLDFFGPRATVASITPQLLKKYQSERMSKRRPKMIHTREGNIFVEDRRPVTNGTVRRELVTLSAALNHAIKNGRLMTAPGIQKPPAPPGKTRFLTKEEIERLLTNCPEPHLRLFIALAINTGARKGALLDLKWDQMDFDNRIIYLNPEGRAQTAKRRAIVPMNNYLRDTLIKAKTEQKEYVLEQIEKSGKEMVLCEHVISFRNQPVFNVRTGFRRSCERAGIKGVTPHTLRHTAGTLMALAGIDLFLIAKVLGHSVQKTTELYAHFQPEYLRGAVNALEAAIPKQINVQYTQGKRPSGAAMQPAGIL